MDEREERIVRERENDWPRSILVIIGALLIFAGYHLLEWVRTESPASELINNVSNPSQISLIRSPETLVHRLVDRNIDGATILLNPVQVESVLGDYVFMIKLEEQKTIPVVLLGEITGRQAERRVEIEAGQTLRVFGFLLPLRDIDMISSADFLDEQEWERLRTHTHYITAVRVVVL